ncbi:MAG: hypothetical protein HQ515_12795 [Phycisphaeraceae bacterium]|nr:hypothetical protein [Phycisphaeraceae bacterium]
MRQTMGLVFGARLLCIAMGTYFVSAHPSVLFEGAAYSDGDVFADTWVASDALGRAVLGFETCGPAKPDKWVGLFYWTWHIPGRGGPHDNTRILAKAQEGPVAWPSGIHGSHHWGEPELGYYLMTDPFVIRKHASMLEERRAMPDSADPMFLVDLPLGDM